MIDLADEAVHAVEEAGGGGKIVAVGATGIDERACDRGVAGLRARAAMFGAGIGIARQQSADTGLAAPLAAIVRCDLRRIGHAGGSGLRSIFALAFIVDVEESLVLDDRATQRAAELIVIERTLRIWDRS